MASAAIFSQLRDVGPAEIACVALRHLSSQITAVTDDRIHRWRIHCKIYSRLRAPLQRQSSEKIREAGRTPFIALDPKNAVGCRLERLATIPVPLKSKNGHKEYYFWDRDGQVVLPRLRTVDFSREEGKKNLQAMMPNVLKRSVPECSANGRIETTLTVCENGAGPDESNDRGRQCRKVQLAHLTPVGAGVLLHAVLRKTKPDVVMGSVNSVLEFRLELAH